MADRLTDDVALALLGNTLPTGAILVVLITILGPLSGAHFNPAVTLVFALRREMTRKRGACLCRRADRGRRRRDASGARHVRAADLAGLGDGAQRRRRNGSPKPSPPSASSSPSSPACASAPTRSLAGRPLHHRRLLVHRLDLLRQPGCRHRARALPTPFPASGRPTCRASSPPNSSARCWRWLSPAGCSPNRNRSNR